MQKLLARKDYEGFLVRGDEVRLQLADWANSHFASALQVPGGRVGKSKDDGGGESSH